MRTQWRIMDRKSHYQTSASILTLLLAQLREDLTWSKQVSIKEELTYSLIRTRFMHLDLVKLKSNSLDFNLNLLHLKRTKLLLISWTILKIRRYFFATRWLRMNGPKLLREFRVEWEKVPLKTWMINSEERILSWTGLPPSNHALFIFGLYDWLFHFNL